MKTTLIPISAATVCAVALVGCEWGGVHSGESWNDAYSWANFTGTYKLVSEIPAETDSEVAGASSTSSATINDAKKFTIAKGAGAASVSGLHTPITAGSLLVSCGSWNFKDDGAGNLVYQGSGFGQHAERMDVDRRRRLAALHLLRRAVAGSPHSPNCDAGSLKS